MPDFPMYDRRDREHRVLLAEGHLIVQANLSRELGDLRQGEPLLRRGGRVDDSVTAVLWVDGQFDPMEREWAAPKSNLRTIFHIREARSRTRDSFRGRATKNPTLDRFQERIQIRHSPEPGIKVGKLTRGAVTNGFSLGGGGIFGQRPGFSPRVKGERIMSGIIIFKTEIGQQRGSPG